MRQRAVIAMAMANEPDLLIADEPTTALDVTIQAQIMELLEKLRQEKGVGIVLVTHDLGVVAGAARSLSIMYSGRVVERGLVDDVFAAPHPSPIPPACWAACRSRAHAWKGCVPFPARRRRSAPDPRDARFTRDAAMPSISAARSVPCFARWDKNNRGLSPCGRGSPRGNP